jgi:hypothetical protein
LSSFKAARTTLLISLSHGIGFLSRLQTSRQFKLLDTILG